MEKLESRADVEVYVRNLVYSLVAPDSPVFEDFVEREIDFLTQVTSLDEKKIGSTYRARVTKGSVLNTVSNIHGNIDEPNYPVIEGPDEWYEFHDSVMTVFDDHGV